MKNAASDLPILGQGSASMSTKHSVTEVFCDDNKSVACTSTTIQKSSDTSDDESFMVNVNDDEDESDIFGHSVDKEIEVFSQ